MAAGTYNFIIEQGTTVDFKIQYKDSTGTPINLTGYEGAMQIRSNFADNNPKTYITLTSENINPDGTGLNFEESNNGLIGIFIASCTSSLFNFNNARYDLEIYSGSLQDCPIVTRILEGNIELSRETTRI
jgi:hypothetical protein